MASSSSRNAGSTLLLIIAAASYLVAAQSSVYVPGQVDDTPGASIINIGAGVDGYTTYIIDGVTLQENSASAIMTQYDTNGQPVVYNCALGLDAQASCSVVQAGGVQYAYTEPITFFGESKGQLPAAYMTAANPTTTAASGINAAAAATSLSSSEAPEATSLSSTRTGGPAANQAQQTASNVFGAADSNGSASSALSKALAGSLFAGIAGAALVFA